VRRAYAEGLERYLSDLALAFASRAADETAGDGQPAADPGARSRAIVLLATLAGGLSLARSVAGVNPALSDELLTVARAQALALAGG